jgi:hypothetical protein
MDTKIKLSQDNLSGYFTLANSTNSIYTKPTNTFNFVGINSKQLTVSVGDSCTWGADLGDETVRLNNAYGRVVANQLNTDWLNLALNGSGNFWIAEQVESLAKIIPKLGYDKIYIICTFTEVGRHFDTESDRYIDYASWLANNIEESNDYQKLLAFLNEECVNRIQTAIKDFSNVTLRIGTNVVEHIGLDQAQHNILPKPWLKLLSEQLNFKYIPDICYFVGLEITVARLKNVLILHPELKKSDYLTWYLKMMDMANEREKISTVPSCIKEWHPNALGHKIWANYILESLNDN